MCVDCRLQYGCVPVPLQPFQQFDDAADSSRQRKEFFRYRKAIEGRSLVEMYREGEVSLVLYLDVWGKINMEAPVGSTEAPCIAAHRLAVLVLHSNIEDRRSIDDRKYESVLVQYRPCAKPRGKDLLHDKVSLRS
jgi:hypothetical protein